MEEFKSESYEHPMGEVKKKKKYVDMNLPGYAIGVRVPGPSNGDLEMALRKFKTIVKEAGIIDEFRDRQEFIKPSVKKRKQKLQAIRRKDSDYYDEDTFF